MFVIVTGDPDHPDYGPLGDNFDCEGKDLPTYVFDRDGSTVVTWPSDGNRDEMAQAVLTRTGHQLHFADRAPNWPYPSMLLPNEERPQTDRDHDTYRYSPDGTLQLATRGRELWMFRRR